MARQAGLVKSRAMNRTGNGALVKEALRRGEASPASKAKKVGYP